MPRFFIDKSDLHDGFAILRGEDAKHIARSLRMKQGEGLVICDKIGQDYSCITEKITDDEVLCRIVSQTPNISEPNIFLTLYQAIPKQDKFDMIIQKSVELGVGRIVPVLTSRCVSRPSDRDFLGKLSRYNKISLEASKQSGRGKVPNVCDVMKFSTAIDEMAKEDISLICYENGGKNLREFDITDGKSISLMVGSEGGFSSEEIELAISGGVEPIFLGNRILRCETASLAATSIIMYLSSK